MLPAKDLLDCSVPQLGIDVPTLHLKNCPNALSVGKRVIDDGFEFHWTSKGCWYKLPGGQRVFHVIKGYCPYLTKGGNAKIAALFKALPFLRMYMSEERAADSESDDGPIHPTLDDDSSSSDDDSDSTHPSMPDLVESTDENSESTTDRSFVGLNANLYVTTDDEDNFSDFSPESPSTNPKLSCESDSDDTEVVESPRTAAEASHDHVCTDDEDDADGGKLVPGTDHDSDADDEGDVSSDSDDEGKVSNAESLRREAKTPKHRMLHLPHNRACKHCRKAKAKRKRMVRNHKVKNKYKGKVPFGTRTTCDYWISTGALDIGWKNEVDALVTFDIGTEWLDICPTKSRTEDDTTDALIDFCGGDRKSIKYMHSDGGPEIKRSIKNLGWANSVGTPGIPQTNNVAEIGLTLRSLVYEPVLVSPGCPLTRGRSPPSTSRLLGTSQSKTETHHGCVDTKMEISKVNESSLDNS